MTLLLGAKISNDKDVDTVLEGLKWRLATTQGQMAYLSHVLEQHRKTLISLQDLLFPDSPQHSLENPFSYS